MHENITHNITFFLNALIYILTWNQNRALSALGVLINGSFAVPYKRTLASVLFLHFKANGKKRLVCFGTSSNHSGFLSLYFFLNILLIKLLT